MRNIALKLILFSALLCCQFQVFGQLSKVHYMPPIASGDNVGDQWLYVSTPNEGFINVTIKPIAIIAIFRTLQCFQDQDTPQT